MTIEQIREGIGRTRRLVTKCNESLDEFETAMDSATEVTAHLVDAFAEYAARLKPEKEAA